MRTTKAKAAKFKKIKTRTLPTNVRQMTIEDAMKSTIAQSDVLISLTLEMQETLGKNPCAAFPYTAACQTLRWIEQHGLNTVKLILDKISANQDRDDLEEYFPYSNLKKKSGWNEDEPEKESKIGIGDMVVYNLARVKLGMPEDTVFIVQSIDRKRGIAWICDLATNDSTQGEPDEDDNHKVNLSHLSTDIPESKKKKWFPRSGDRVKYKHIDGGLNDFQVLDVNKKAKKVEIIDYEDADEEDAEGEWVKVSELKPR